MKRMIMVDLFWASREGLAGPSDPPLTGRNLERDMAPKGYPPADGLLEEKGR